MTQIWECNHQKPERHVPNQNTEGIIILEPHDEATQDRILEKIHTEFHQVMLLLARRSTKHTDMENPCHMLKTAVICSVLTDQYNFGRADYIRRVCKTY